MFPKVVGATGVPSRCIHLILYLAKYFPPDIAQGCTSISLDTTGIAIAIHSTARQR